MRAVVQRVRAAHVTVGDEVTGRIDRGLVVLLGIGLGDEARDLSWMVDKIVGLRVFEDDAGKMSRALADVGGALLVVSQFTLYGDVSRGRRPSFEKAMPPAEAERMYDQFVEAARARGVQVATGRFRADMLVSIENDGPVTLILDSRG